MKPNTIRTVCVLTLITVATVLPACPPEGVQISTYSDGSVDPIPPTDMIDILEYFPLAVGNSWHFKNNLSTWFTEFTCTEQISKGENHAWKVSYSYRTPNYDTSFNFYYVLTDELLLQSGGDGAYVYGLVVDLLNGLEVNMGYFTVLTPRYVADTNSPVEFWNRGRTLYTAVGTLKELHTDIFCASTQQLPYTAIASPADHPTIVQYERGACRIGWNEWEHVPVNMNYYGLGIGPLVIRPREETRQDWDYAMLLDHAVIDGELYVYE